jgi:glutamate formiminotransferase/glutamate formiminotransferase/formiminotetrahydrofolate cyclodeaminase
LSAPTLLAVPNVSEGRDPEVIRRIGEAFADAPGVRLLDVHSDPDHQRSVFTLSGAPGTLAPALISGAREVLALIDLSRHAGLHPRIGALDIAPIVHLEDQSIGAACAEALVLGDRLGEELGLPVFLYGALGGGRTRADVRRGGPEQLGRRMEAGELRPDFGPAQPHPTGGAVLVGARPPLLAFNVELAPPASQDDARRIAAAIREGAPDGLPGLRVLGLWLARRGIAQVSMNVEDPRAAPLATIVEAIARHATPARAELVGLAPRAALEGFPADLPLHSAGTIEDALAAADPDG